MVSQNLKTVVTLGGTVDGSFGKIGSAFNESMGKATKTVKELEREQSKLTKEIKVAQLSGYVAEHSAYHHGEVSLQTTIVSLA